MSGAPSGWRRLDDATSQAARGLVSCKHGPAHCCQPVRWEQRMPGGVYVYWCEEHARGRRPAN